MAVIVVAVALGVVLITTLTGNSQRAEQAGTAAATSEPASEDTKEQSTDASSTEASEDASSPGVSEEASSSEASPTGGGSGAVPAFPTSFGDYNLSGPADKVSARYASTVSAMQFSVSYTDTESTYDIWLGRMRDVRTIGGLKCGEMTPNVPQCIAKAHGGAIHTHLTDSFEEKSTHEEVAKRTQEFLKAWH